MESINKSLENVTSIGNFAKKYFSYLSKVLESIDENEINKLGSMFLEARNNNKTIFIAGNGGSATTASTMSNDMGFDILKKTNTDKPFKLLSLVDNNSVLTAISNDVGYENTFLNQLKIHYQKDDYLLLISASGNSPNIIKAANWVKQRGGKLIGFTGFDGGELLKICDCKIHVKTNLGEYGPVEDAHLIINHVLAHWFQNNLD